MATSKSLFTRVQRDRIAAAITRTERDTSVEIRVHVEPHCIGEPIDRAGMIFEELGMHRTRQRNGILIYVAIEDRQTAILGDVGVNACVAPDFWQRCYEAMAECFNRNEFTEGICVAIDRIETELKPHFPSAHDDENELSDEISFTE